MHPAHVGIPRLSLAIAAGLSLSVLTLMAGAPGGSSAADIAAARADTTDQALTILSQDGGAASAVSLAGTTAYLAIGPRLVAMDVTQPDQPRQIGSAQLTVSLTSVQVDGNWVYAATEAADASGALWVFDVSDPQHPTAVGEVATNVPWRYLVKRGNLVYAPSDTALLVFDVSNPAHPAALPWVTDDALSGEDRPFTEGNRLYVVSFANGLLFYDLTYPAAPQLLGNVPGEGGSGLGIVDAAVVNQRAYLADAFGLRIVDVTDPTQPKDLGSADITMPMFVDVAGTVATVVDDTGFLTTFSVSDPAHPSPTGSVEFVSNGHGSYTDLARGGQLAYVTNEASGLWVVDLTDPKAPLVAGRHEPPSIIAQGIVDGNHAYVVGAAGNLWALDIADPAAPKVVGSMADQVDLPAFDVIASSGGYLVAAGCSGDVGVIDVRDPTSPKLVGTVALTATGTVICPLGTIAVSGDLAYVAFGQKLWVISLHDPAAPSILGSVEVDMASTVALAASCAYVGGAADGTRSQITIVRITDPAQPTVVGSVDLGGEYAPGLAVVGQQLFAAGETLRIYDLARPDAPVSVGEVPVRGFSVAARAGQVFLDGFDGLRVYDVTDPANPLLTDSGALPTPDRGEPQVSLSGDLLLSARQELGFYLLRAPALAPHPTATPTVGTPTTPTPTQLPPPTQTPGYRWHIWLPRLEDRAEVTGPSGLDAAGGGRAWSRWWFSVREW
jgi:hypothetical protein